MAQCAVCGNPVSPTWWVCESCERAYDLKKPYAQWPEWVKFLRQEEKKRRYREAETVDVMCFSDMPGLEDLMSGAAEDGSAEPAPTPRIARVFM